MKLILEILLMIILGILFYQDIKERRVSLWLLIFGLLLGGTINFISLSNISFVINSLINLIFIALVFCFLWGYAKLKMKKQIFEVFGRGDLLFFIVLAVSLPILSFLMVFIFSIIFALIVFLILKSKLKEDTVPLAGLQSLFFLLVLMVNKFMNVVNIYEV
ncbi:prepilin peptidase [Polaribacter sp. Asnod6-C07]|uniref:prepilin peptidase n=1 Tax=Polaribacter sp. Asnod6-C07 TaxID=3160582 RepID=UPI00386CB50F